MRTVSATVGRKDKVGTVYQGDKKWDLMAITAAHAEYHRARTDGTEDGSVVGGNVQSRES